ncbi:MAG: hypothetical protein K0S68_98 [Candidatus Saccharibacteria bacterium]|jgi:hypothetical protein|nr:hypothetical protein [Candidatus Saccharibacteria bacterium]
MSGTTEIGTILPGLLDQAVKMFWESPVRQVTDADGTVRYLAVDDSEAVRTTVLNFVLNHDGNLDALREEIKDLEIPDGSMLYAWEQMFLMLAKVAVWLMKELERNPELQDQSWFRYANRENPDWLAEPIQANSA